MNILNTLDELKNFGPRAGERGYAMLTLPEDSEKLSELIVRIKGQSPDTVLRVDLPGEGRKSIKTRELFNLLYQRPLKRGEFDRTVIMPPHFANIVVIDRVERLNTEAFTWICTQLREAADLFFVVIRDKELFIKKFSNNGWILGRSMVVELADFGLSDDVADNH